MEAKVLRLLRYDAKRWWYHQALRKQGQIDKAIKLERQSIRDSVKTIRENINREATTHYISVIEFLDKGNGTSYTTCMSNVHPGMFAAWIYCYANRIGSQR